MSHEDVLFSAETLRLIIGCESVRLADDVDWCIANGFRDRASRVLLTQNRLQLAAQVLERVIPRGPSPITAALDHVKLCRAAAYAATQMTQAVGIFEECLSRLRAELLPHQPAVVAALDRMRAPIEGLRAAVSSLDPLLPAELPPGLAPNPAIDPIRSGDFGGADDILGGPATGSPHV